MSKRNSKIQGLSRPQSDFPVLFNANLISFLGLLKEVLYIQVIFKPVCSLDWPDAQTDLSLCWVRSDITGFVMHL